MREIKFRAWDRAEKVMMKVDGMALGKGFSQWGTGIFDEHNDFNDFKHIELMQFTGLKDRNGKEIYEGDIVKISDSIDATAPNKNVGIVKFMEGRSRWYLDTGEFNDWTELRREVIGDIYSNPELLKGAKK